jgi:uncharacterized protein (DUF3820 family)
MNREGVLTGEAWLGRILSELMDDGVVVFLRAGFAEGDEGELADPWPSLIKEEGVSLPFPMAVVGGDGARA